VATEEFYHKPYLFSVLRTSWVATQSTFESGSFKTCGSDSEDPNTLFELKEKERMGERRNVSEPDFQDHAFLSAFPRNEGHDERHSSHLPKIDVEESSITLIRLDMPF
jgi:hypothetical protein